MAYRQEKWDKAKESGQIALDLFSSMEDEEMQEKSQRLLDAIEKRSKRTGFLS